jgi:transposase InsO family protein
MPTPTRLPLPLRGRPTPVARDDSQESPKTRSSRKKAHEKRSKKFRSRGKARKTSKESDTEDESVSEESSEESAHRVWIGVHYADRAISIDPDRSEKKVKKWTIDGCATSHCTGDIQCLEKLDTRYRGVLKTAGGNLKIMGKGIARVPLTDGVARLNDVLYVPDMEENLLSTQVFYRDGIYNAHEKDGYRFDRKDRKTLATGYNIGRTSYLGSVKSQDALITKSRRMDNEEARIVQSGEPDWDLLHKRFGHPGKPRMKRLAKRMGLKLPESYDLTCETCIQAKSVKRQNRGEVPKEKEPLQRVYIDFWGPYQGQYYLAIVDDATRFSWLYITDNRRTETVIETLERWMAREERVLGKALIDIRLDNAKEFAALESWAGKKGIDLEFTEPYTPPQNGPAERLNRFILEIARAIMQQMNVPKKYWQYAVRMANFLRNRTVFTPREGKKRKSAYEMISKKKYNLAKLKVPFCKVWFHIETKDKLDPRAQEGVFVGYTKSSSQYLVLDRQRRVRKVTNPNFLEDERGFISDEAGDREFANDEAYNSLIEKCCMFGNISTSHVDSSVRNHTINPIINSAPTTVISPTVLDHKDDVDATTAVNESYNQEPITLTTPDLVDPTSPITTPSTEAPQPNAPMRRSGRVRMQTQALIESQQTDQIYGRKSRQERRREEREASKASTTDSSSQVSHEETRLRETANLAVAIELLLGEDDEFALRVDKRLEGEQIPIPKTYEEAVNHPIYGPRWREAIGLEIRNLIRFGTWKFVKRPIGRSVISCKWVFDLKYGADGRLERFKARLVARGFSQQEGLDFEDTFAPVIRLESLRVLFAIAASYGMVVHLLDATNAFVGSRSTRKCSWKFPRA